jgi:hypothetical protein
LPKGEGNATKLNHVPTSSASGTCPQLICVANYPTTPAMQTKPKGLHCYTIAKSEIRYVLFFTENSEQTFVISACFLLRRLWCCFPNVT